MQSEHFIKKEKAIKIKLKKKNVKKKMKKQRLQTGNGAFHHKNRSFYFLLLSIT